MPMRPENQRTFDRHLYAGWLQTVTLLKRDDDQRQGTVTSYKVFNCRWSKIHKAGEPIQKDMSSSHSRRLHIPNIELDRIGIDHLNALDRFIDKQGRHWQAESNQTITKQLGEVHTHLDCLRVDPPIISG